MTDTAPRRVHRRKVQQEQLPDPAGLYFVGRHGARRDLTDTETDLDLSDADLAALTSWLVLALDGVQRERHSREAVSRSVVHVVTADPELERAIARELRTAGLYAKAGLADAAVAEVIAETLRNRGPAEATAEQARTGSGTLVDEPLPFEPTPGTPWATP